MANENKDVIRVFELEADLTSVLRAGMLGFATDTHRMARKKLSDSSMAYWSDDTKQMLLAGAQTITGNKTYSGTNIYNGVVTFNETANFHNEIILHSDGRADFGAGFSNLTNARASQDSVANINRIVIADTASSDNYYSFSDLTDGQVLYLSAIDACSACNIDIDPINQVLAVTFVIGAGEAAVLVYDGGLLQNYTNG
jgi:hypothetical protein